LNLNDRLAELICAEIGLDLSKLNFPFQWWRESVLINDCGKIEMRPAFQIALARLL
jgi:hypothetical protein